MVLDEECNLWAIEAERSWGLDPWKPEDAAFWSLDVGSETLCVNEGNGERTVFHQMPLDAAASRDPSAERPEESSPLLMVFGADYNPGRDPLPRGKFRARCAWSPAPPPPAE